MPKSAMKHLSIAEDLLDAVVAEVLDKQLGNLPIETVLALANTHIALANALREGSNNE